jgi:hypothetical protein
MGELRVKSARTELEIKMFKNREEELKKERRSQDKLHTSADNGEPTI